MHSLRSEFIRTGLAVEEPREWSLARLVQEYPILKLRDFPVPGRSLAFIVPAHEPLWVRTAQNENRRDSADGYPLGDIAVLVIHPLTGESFLLRTRPRDDGKMPEEFAGGPAGAHVAVIERHEEGFIVRIKL